MMTDIVETLRKLASVDNCQASLEAADEITRLRAALRECESVAVTHHAEDVSRTDWSGSEKRFYKQLIAKADERFERHLAKRKG